MTHTDRLINKLDLVEDWIENAATAYPGLSREDIIDAAIDLPGAIQERDAMDAYINAAQPVAPYRGGHVND